MDNKLKFYCLWFSQYVVLQWVLDFFGRKQLLLVVMKSGFFSKNYFDDDVVVFLVLTFSSQNSWCLYIFSFLAGGVGCTLG
jgi:hypothetical protein